MMTLVRRLPVLPTIVVLVAVGIMIRLGLWQLDRLQEKEALLEHYASGTASDELVAWPDNEEEAEERLYRRTRLDCASVGSRSAIAGKNVRGEAGVAQVATCNIADGGKALVALGWSSDPAAAIAWQGGEVTGIIAPGPRLIADPPLGGLEANAVPDPSEIPNNHLAYAVQWFLFALVALVIYGLAVRKRLAGGGAGG
jgi:surfeit locus 1 family protein